MEDALRFFRTYEYVIYILLGALAIWEIRRFIMAWEEVRQAAFGLERESAQSRLNRAATMLVLILFFAISEFTLVTFVAPTIPGANPLLTPTIDLMATPTYTLGPSLISEVDADETPVPPTRTPVGEGCINSQLEITDPKNGDPLSGQVTIMGTVDLPNLAFYKYEVARPGETIWLPIQAGRGAVREGKLGDWYTNTLPPGEYVLRLVATDNEGGTLGTCQINIYINPTPVE